MPQADHPEPFSALANAPPHVAVLIAECQRVSNELVSVRAHQATLADDVANLQTQNFALKNDLGVARALVPAVVPVPVLPADDHVHVPSSASGPRVSGPQVFEGSQKDNVDGSISKCDRVFGSYPRAYHSDMLKVDFVCNLLSGDAHRFTPPPS